MAHQRTHAQFGIPHPAQPFPHPSINLINAAKPVK